MSTPPGLKDTICIIPLRGIPEVERGSSLARLVIEAATAAEVGISQGDVVAVAQKVVSKAEGRLVRLDEVRPTPAAVEHARRMNRDPRHLEVIPERVEAHRSENGKSLDFPDPSRLDMR